MKLAIPANNVKIFAKTIHCLCRLGNEIYLDLAEDGLGVKTLNASRSIFASFVFPADFFDKFQPVIEGQEEWLVCKISVKTFLQVFRSLNFVEKSVETCEITLSENLDQLIFTLNCRHAVVKTFQLNYEECESLKALYTKDLSPNKLQAPSKLLLEVLANFNTSLDEISLSVTPCKVTLSSFTDNEEVGKCMSTEMNLSPKEFEYFQVGVDSCVSFCLKDLRSILTFADSCGTNCKMSFEHGGKPLVVELEVDNIFTSNFVLATIAGSDSSQQASTSVVSETFINRQNDSSIRNNVSKNKKPQKRKNGQVENSHVHEKVRPQNQSDEGDEHVTVRVSDLLFSDAQQSQMNNKAILAADSDEDS